MNDYTNAKGEISFSGFFGKYTDMIEAFKILKVDEIHLEHCSLHYKMLDVFNDWKFDGKVSLGVIDQRIDNTETEEDIERRLKTGKEEIKDYKKHDYVITNFEVEETVEFILAIVRAEKSRVTQYIPTSEDIKEIMDL